MTTGPMATVRLRATGKCPAATSVASGWEAQEGPGETARLVSVVLPAPLCASSLLFQELSQDFLRPLVLSLTPAAALVLVTEMLAAPDGFPASSSFPSHQCLRLCPSDIYKTQIWWWYLSE